MTKDELLILERHLSSIHFTIPTRAIMELMSAVGTWMSNCDCGSIIYGRPRVGKTRAIIYITNELKKIYGNELPIYVLNATDHTVSDKFFYSEMLKAVGCPEVHKGTVLMLKERLLNTLAATALDTKYKKIVLFIDEAYLLHEKDFVWLMDIYNNLNLFDIQFTVFMFGSYELKQVKTHFCATKKLQIVGRFMVEEFKFEGISSPKDAFVCLLNMDRPLRNYHNNEVILTESFFPDAYKDGKRLAKCDLMLWNAFSKVIQEKSLHENDIPMKYMMSAITYCLRTYGSYGKGIYFPDESAWMDSVINSGYLKAMIGFGADR